MQALFDLTGQSAVVVGASSGIGAGLAKMLALAGANVAILARRLERLKSLAAELQERCHVKCLALRCDVADEEQIMRAVEGIITHFGTVHILVNNAAVQKMARAIFQTSAMFDEVMDINIKGLFLMTREIGKHMIANRYGRVINISSIGSVRAAFYPLAPYYASKAAVDGLTRALAVEWGEYNITVNAVLPGLIETEMSKSMGIPNGATPERMELARRKGEALMKIICPLRRMGQVSDFTGIILLLASPASGYITGQTIAVDGGLTIGFNREVLERVQPE
jgi:NAD(P)-dependent dehydrogenase (short-subunit alcohol dehydrogenase family)